LEVSGAVTVALDAPPGKDLPRDRVALAFLLAALVLGLFRFVDLGRWSLWLDEALTLADARHGEPPSNPLGYAVFARLYDWLGSGRPDEHLLRLPAALFGFLVVPATAWVFRPWFGRRAAALAAFFVAASGWHLYWSQNARFYTLAQLLTLVGAGLVLRGLEHVHTRRTALGLGLLLAAAAVHPSAALLAAPLLFLPWIPRWLEWIPPERASGRPWSLLSAAGLATLLVGSGWGLRVFSMWGSRHEGGGGLAGLQHFALTSGYLFTPTLGLAFLFGLRRGWGRRTSFVPWAATLLALGFAAGLSLVVRVSAQYVFVLLPWVAAVAALAFADPDSESAGPPAPSRRRAVARILLVIAVALPGLVDGGLYFLVRHGDRPRWREAYAHVFEHSGPGDLVLGMEAAVGEYYLDPDTDDLRDWRQVVKLDTHSLRWRLPEDWARHGRCTWLVVNAEQLEDWDGEARERFTRFLQEECLETARFEVPWTPRDLDVAVYRTR
jgi:hypothetical protein